MTSSIKKSDIKLNQLNLMDIQIDERNNRIRVIKDNHVYSIDKEHPHYEVIVDNLLSIGNSITNYKDKVKRFSPHNE
jgi:hypothetical protein